MKELSDSEIVEALATKIMGWRAVGGGWHDVDNKHVAYIGECGDYYCQGYPHCDWNPLEHAGDSKQVREKLLERFISWSLKKHKHERFEFTVYPGSFYGYGDTEERAVALVALSTLAQPAEE